MSKQAQFGGVKNVTEKEQDLMHDGEHYKFAPGEVRILHKDIAKHAGTRLEISQQGRAVVGRAPFAEIPLNEAIKAGATLEESADIVAARQSLADKEAERKQLAEEIRAEVIAQLKADGMLKTPKER